ncbi:MAG: hypothetical protein C0404_03700 [Verrucomicrobia bacterium]|nr:hypothetical protein [Verrucomicrobiota bacterium]
METFLRRLRLAAIALVAVTLITPTVIYLGAYREAIAAVERLSVNSNLGPVGARLSSIESHFSENYGFRSSLITAANTVRYRLFQVSPSKDVILGKNGWLFYYSPTDGDIVADYRRSNLDADANLQSLCRMLVERRDILKRQGTEYVIMVAPNKGSIYPEYLPDCLASYGGVSRYDRLMDYLAKHTDLHVVNVKPALLEAKLTAKHPLYELNHTGWNDIGAFIAYTELCRELRTIYPSLAAKQFSDYKVQETNCVRGLEGMLAVKGYPTPSEPALVGTNMVSTDFGRRGLVSYTNPAPKPGLLPKTVVFRDCFFSRPSVFFADHCERLDAYWTLFFSMQVVEVEKPGLVIQEVAERYIDHLYQ